MPCSFDRTPARAIPNDSGHSTSIWMDLEVPAFDGGDPPAGAVSEGADVVVLDDGPRL